MSSEIIDISKLRISQDVSEELLGEELSSPVEVAKPRKQVYFRVHPDAAFRLDTLLLWFEEEGRWYLPSPNLRHQLADELVVVKLVTCIDLYRDVFLWPLKVPGSEGRASNWYITAVSAVDQGITRWVRLIPDLKRQKYRIFAGSADLAEPEWPEKALQDYVQEAFSDFHITSLDHPVVKKLRGKL